MIVIGTKCIVTSELLKWYKEEEIPLPFLLKLGEEARVIFISSVRDTAMIEGLESGVILAGIPLEVIERIRVKR